MSTEIPTTGGTDETICPRCSIQMVSGDRIVASANATAGDGALHVIWQHYRCPVTQVFATDYDNILGPFSVTFGTAAFFTAAGVSCLALAAGDVIFDAWTVVTAAWDTQVRIGLQTVHDVLVPLSASGGISTATSIGPGDPPVGVDGSLGRGGWVGQTVNTILLPYVAGSTTTLSLFGDTAGGGTATMGSFDVYLRVGVRL